MNGVIASALVLVSPIMSAVGLDGFFWIFFSMNIVFLLICYMPMFPAFLKLRSVDPDRTRIFRMPGGKAAATVACWVPVVLLILSMIATIVPLNGSEEELSKIPMLVGVLAFAVISEIVRVVSARKRTEEYRGMALDGDPEEWDAAHGSLDPAVEAGLEEVAERDLEFERG